MTATPSGDDYPSEVADENCPVDCTEPARDSGTARSFSPSEVNLRQNKKRSSSCGKVDINDGETDDGASVDDEDMAIVNNINNNKNKKTRSNSNETSLHEIEAIWRPFNTKLAGNISEDSSNGSIHNAVQETITMLLKAYDELIQPVGQVMAQLQERTNHIQALEQAQATKDREIDRLRQAERKGRESIAVRGFYRYSWHLSDTTTLLLQFGQVWPFMFLFLCRLLLAQILSAHLASLCFREYTELPART